MRGLPDYNFPLFHKAAAALRKQGHEVWSPAEHDEREGFDPKTDDAAPLRHYMKTDLAQVCDADAIAVLDGWEDSVGAALEVHVARTCDIPVYSVKHSEKYGGVAYLNILRPELEPEPWDGYELTDDGKILLNGLQVGGLLRSSLSDHVTITESGKAALGELEPMPPVPDGFPFAGMDVNYDMKFDKAEHFDTGAIRSDATGKGRYDLLPPAAIRRVAIIYEKGAAQKGDRNWENGIPDSRLYSSALRHIFQAMEGKRDEDHVAHAAWNLLAILHFDSQRTEEVNAA